MLIHRLYHRMEDTPLKDWVINTYGDVRSYHIKDGNIVLDIHDERVYLSAGLFMKKLKQHTEGKHLRLSCVLLWCLCCDYDIHDDTGYYVATMLANKLKIPTKYVNRFFYDSSINKFISVWDSFPNRIKIKNLKFVDKGDNVLVALPPCKWLHTILYRRLKKEVEYEHENG